MYNNKKVSKPGFAQSPNLPVPPPPQINRTRKTCQALMSNAEEIGISIMKEIHNRTIPSADAIELFAILQSPHLQVSHGLGQGWREYYKNCGFEYEYLKFQQVRTH